MRFRIMIAAASLLVPLAIQTTSASACTYTAHVKNLEIQYDTYKNSGHPEVKEKLGAITVPEISMCATGPGPPAAQYVGPVLHYGEASATGTLTKKGVSEPASVHLSAWESESWLGRRASCYFFTLIEEQCARLEARRGLLPYLIGGGPQFTITTAAGALVIPFQGDAWFNPSPQCSYWMAYRCTDTAFDAVEVDELPIYGGVGYGTEMMPNTTFTVELVQPYRTL